jgi:hypothetical protein
MSNTNDGAWRQDETVLVPSTSPQRTYRYVRLSILGAVLMLTVSLVAVLIDSGPIASISAAVYTPARSIFIGSLFAVGLALLALSGHSLQQGLLDIAALCAPIIAIVPTVISTGDVPGYVPGCPDPATPCVPGAELATVRNGMIAFIIVAVIGIATAAVLTAVQRTFSVGVVASIAAASVLVAGAAVWWLAAPQAFLDYGHLVATSTFFGLTAIVAALAAVTSAPPWRACYGVIAAAIALDIVFLVTVIALRLNGVDLVRATGVPLIFIGEALAVALFAAFWLLQTVQLWNEPDPAFRASVTVPRAATD